MKPIHPLAEKLDLVFTTEEILRIGLRKGRKAGIRSSLDVLAVSFLGPVHLHNRNESIAFLRNGLDDGRPLRVIAEVFPEVRDAVGQSFVGDESTFPDLLKDIVLGDDLTGVLRKVDEDLHGPRLEMKLRLVVGHGAERGMNHPISETKRVFHVVTGWRTGKPGVILYQNRHMVTT